MLSIQYETKRGLHKIIIDTKKRPSPIELGLAYDMNNRAIK